ncbi:MAG: HAD-IIB family hydrolase [Erysipelotrichaceae bacterium]|nr:HAD-IIB family hydrolase [Erysipelotrichaceae bacterium]
MTYEKWYKLYHPHKRYFFFDIDGTLTDNATKKVVPSALKALKKLQAAGHFVAIATGRAHYKASMMMEELGLHNMVCSGGKCLVMNDEIVENIPLDRDKVLAIIAQATSLGYGILAMIDDSIDVYAKDDLFCQQVGPRKEPTNYIIDPNIDFTQIPHFYKLYVAISSDQENRLTLKESLGHLRFVKDYLMFQHDAKDEGICLFMDKLQQDHKDVVVFGDDHNDLVMFKPRWTSIAMGNACSELKAKATYVTAKNVDDGIYQACEKFGWFKQI